MTRILTTAAAVVVLALWGGAPAWSAPDNGDFIVSYETPESEAFLDYEGLFRETALLDDVIDVLNELVVLPHDIHVVLGECGTANAFYSPDDEAVVLCYELIDSFWEVFFADAGTDEEFEEAGASMAGATLFILFHEIGHVLVDVHELPITGREEDAVDQLATVLLAESDDIEVEAAALDAAVFFAAAADQEGINEEAFWGEHALDAQRFYNIICWLYGSDPETWSDLVGEDGLPPERAERCPAEYQRLASAWETLLNPFLKDE